MSELLPFLMTTETEAARLAEVTLGAEHRLAPRRVEAGPRVGQYALPRRVMFDDAFIQHRDAFALMTEVALDPQIAWPAPADEEEQG